MKPRLMEQSEHKSFRLNSTLDILPKNNKYYFYILQCINDMKYYGHTNNLKERFNDHIKGYIRSTKNKQPQLAYFEECNSNSEAFKREMQFKNGKTRKDTIEKLIKSFPKAKCQGFNSQTSRRFRRDYNLHHFTL